MHICPKRLTEDIDNADQYLDDDSCSYCGSLSPDIFMSRLERGDVKLSPTDKNYKVYIVNVGGRSFKQQYRSDSKPFINYDSDDHTWITRNIEETKFYFDHLSIEQRKRFAELLNTKKINIDDPGYFYILPFFLVRLRDQKV